MSTKQYTVKQLILSSWIHHPTHHSLPKFAPLSPLRNWLNNLEVSDRHFAHKLCRTIPTQCPFERQINFLGRTLLRIPPLCKLNPLYNEVVALRFRAICFLADECGEDVSSYC
ncbi:Mo-dependent nitrogenase family protein [Hyella patelloides LEGE 07179]|uniref:Mo-dependent nitrogenase family protein n=1 Tax=Hyella patelloides LEGE 07179 TaxID=945734 RepID=A0A563VNN6_9CYAN|nr:Mo-dependent nitrogenase C-terminal domain-containing protein [Hyella patelloides]VEP13054.1 Mo-dependent nitrogenase family protein [Hyella patelloides LEGE 07179]